MRGSVVAVSVPVLGRAFLDPIASRTRQRRGGASLVSPRTRNGEFHRRYHHPRDVAPTISCHGARRRDYLTLGNDSRLVGGIVSRLA